MIIGRSKTFADGRTQCIKLFEEKAYRCNYSVDYCTQGCQVIWEDVHSRNNGSGEERMEAVRDWKRLRTYVRLIQFARAHCRRV